MQEIVCALCGRRTPLAPGSTMACPSCGAPISAPAPASLGDDDSATRPSIPPVDTPARDIGDITTNVAQPVNLLDDGDTTRSADITADLPSPPAPARTQTIPAQAMPSTESQTQPALPSEAPAAWPASPATDAKEAPRQAAARKRASSGLISILLLIVLLLIVGGFGILLANGRLPLFSASPAATTASTATSAPTATPTSNLIVYTDSGNVFSVGHPNGWLQTIQNDSANQQRLVIFSNPTTGANFNVGVYATTTVAARQVAESVLAVLAQKSGIANHGASTTVFAAGQTWAQESGDVTVEQNGKLTAMHAVALATIHGGNTVYVLELAPVDTFPAIDPEFQQILLSFEFSQ